MTPDEINRKIAERCGWKLKFVQERQFCYPGGWREVTVQRWFSNDGIFELPQNGLPNYYSSLDAMHEAIVSRIRCGGVYGTTLDKCAEAEFQKHLDFISEREQIPEFLFGADLYAEAFLRVFNEWKA